MHPHIADLIVTDRIDGLMQEAARGRLAHADTRSPHRPGWVERIARAMSRRTVRPGHRGIVRQA
jgi:hypothetical protein